ncbi:MULTISPECIES: hypothetical protein [unclassified Yoonia]|uniref:hypothetical protein n=1 Tax=unclassified Yoonia TaxID=2629118 RepID=UPI002AFEA5BD|nr:MULTISPECIES: hypothetical protein [unclassified Yoonia]
MRWDKARILPVVLSESTERSKLLWLSPSEPTYALVAACDLALIELFHSPEISIALTVLANVKPDIVVYDITLATAHPDTTALIKAYQATETLAILPYVPTLSAKTETIGLLNQQSSTANCFITVRSTLRRERPIAIKDLRSTNVFTLDCQQFRLCQGERCATMSKTDHCVIGPFFDAPEAVLDKQSLAKLVFGNRVTSLRSNELHIFRMRSRIKKQIGVDPLRVVRGIGFTLAGD